MAATPGVLVIDDDPRIRTVLQAVLTDSGYTVRIASNGGAALALLGAWRPDVILLDLQMNRPEFCGDSDYWAFANKGGADGWW
jgi:CheY-like chemotaxis protein